MFKGFIWVVVSSILFGLAPSINQYVLLSGMESECVVFFANFTQCLLAGAAVLLTRQSFRARPSQIIHCFFMGAVGMGLTTYLQSLSYHYISVGLTIMLHFLYPSVVSVVMVLLFHQRFTRWKGFAILASLLGIAFISDPSGDVALPGILLALMTSLTYAFYIVSNEKGPSASMAVLPKLFYIALGSSATFLFLSFQSGHFSLPVSPQIWLMATLGMGGVCFLAFLCITIGIEKIGASRASFVNMLEPVTNMVVSTLAYHTIPTAMMLLGSALILCSVFFVAMDGHTVQQMPKKEEHLC